MNFHIYENGKEVNVICADREFTESYCRENGYTFKSDEDLKWEKVKADMDYLAMEMGVEL